MTENLRILTTKLQGALAQFPYVPRALSLVRAAAGPWMLAWVVLLVVQGIVPVATVYVTRALVDSLVAALGSGGAWENIRPTLMLVILMAGIMFLTELLRSITGWMRTAQTELVKDHISALIHQKSIAADLAFYETPEYYDHLHRASQEAKYRPVALLERLGNLLQNGITLVAMAVVLIPFGLWLPVALLFSTLPALYVVVHYSVRQHQWYRRTTADERRTWYMTGC